MVSGKDNSALAQQLVIDAPNKYRIDAGQLTIHQDRDAPIRVDHTIDFISDDRVVLSLSWPRMTNDNAFSEAQLKTQTGQLDYRRR